MGKQHYPRCSDSCLMAEDRFYRPYCEADLPQNNSTARLSDVVSYLKDNLQAQDGLLGFSELTTSS